jgi:hypothetical protein
METNKERIQREAREVREARGEKPKAGKVDHGVIARQVQSEMADERIARNEENIHRLGGQSKSLAKQAAARRNGVKGGRPRGKNNPTVR